MSFKASETLLGIETIQDYSFRNLTKGFKASETLLGIETLYQLFGHRQRLLLQSL